VSLIVVRKCVLISIETTLSWYHSLLIVYMNNIYIYIYIYIDIYIYIYIYIYILYNKNNNNSNSICFEWDLTNLLL